MKDLPIDMIQHETTIIAESVVKAFSRYTARGIPNYVATGSVVDGILETNMPVTYKVDYVNTEDSSDVRSYYFRDFEDACQFLDQYDHISFPIPVNDTWIHVTGIPFFPNILDLNRVWTQDEDGDDVGEITEFRTFGEHVAEDNITMVEIVGAYTATMPQYSQMTFDSLLTARVFVSGVLDQINLYFNRPYAFSFLMEVEDSVGRIFYMPFTFYHGSDSADVTEAINEFMEDIDKADKLAVAFDPAVDTMIDLTVDSVTLHYLPEFGLVGQYRDLLMAILPVRTTETDNPAGQ